MKIVILANHCLGLLSFRKELLETLLSEKHEVVVCMPKDDRENELRVIGCRIIPIIHLARRGTNPIKDIVLLKEYCKIIDKERPDVVLTYTIKPNVYGGMVCARLNVPYIVNITGLGTAVETPGILQKLTLGLYKKAMCKVGCIFFQNQGNRDFFQKHNIQPSKYRTIPGSGVNLAKFVLQPYPAGDKIKFLFISRLMREKGIEEYFAAAEYFTSLRSDVEFHVLGICEDDYSMKLKELTEKNIIIYHGLQTDIRPFLKSSSCLIHPTFYPEGMSNVILEAAASGRPVITTLRYGCKEAVEDGKTGFLFPEKNTSALIECIDKFLHLSPQQRARMGEQGRRKMEREFDRQIVVRAYLEEINKAIKN